MIRSITTIGFIVSLLLTTSVLTVFAEQPKNKSPEYFILLPTYDATGTWDASIKGGWTDCYGGPIPDTNLTAEIYQTGSVFNIYFDNSPVEYGTVSGSNYQISILSSVSSTSIVWTLKSSSVGNGYFSRIYFNDNVIRCSDTAEFDLIKRGPCTPTETLMCLRNGRFSVAVTWEDQYGKTGVGHATPTTDDSGLFWFFSPNNMELLIKVLDGCGFNSKYWVFFAATTDQAFTIRVTDLSTSQSVEYTNPLKNPADAITDTSAFATCP